MVPADWQWLVGRRPDDALWRDAAERVARTLAPDGDIHATAEDRRQIARALARRALAEAAARARP